MNNVGPGLLSIMKMAAFNRGDHRKGNPGEQQSQLHGLNQEDLSSPMLLSLERKTEKQMALLHTFKNDGSEPSWLTRVESWQSF